MTTVENLRRQTLLLDTLRSMAEHIYNPLEIQSATDIFYTIYEDTHFRHRYSDFLPLVRELNEDSNKYDLDALLHNLELLNKFVGENTDIIEHTGDCLFKLCDHLNLEIARLKTDSNDNKMKDAEILLQHSMQDLKIAETKIKTATTKAESLQTEVIAVLSIFSAIVIAFFGGVNYISSAMTSISQTHIFKATLICLVCGFVMLNTIFMLLYFVGKLTQRNIYAHCESDNCTCGEKMQPRCSTIKRLCKRFPYVFWINVSILCLAMIDISAWLFNFYHSGGCLY